MVEGGPILPPSVFDQQSGFEADFSKALQNLFGTDTGIGQTDGDLKSGFWVEDLQSYATGANNNSSEVNGEQQAYFGPNSSAPNFLSQFESVTIGQTPALKIKARLADQATESGWAHYRGYHRLANGDRAKQDWFVSGNGFPSGPPAAWDPVVESDGTVRFEKYPARFVSGCLSTYNRYAQSFGDFSETVIVPAGGRDRSNMPPRDQSVSDQFGLVTPSDIGADVNDVDSNFCAAWILQEVLFGMDLNGEPEPGGDTHTPGNPAGAGLLTEPDTGEWFGDSSTSVHHTLHYYEDGTPDIISTSLSPPPTVDDIRLVHTYGIHVTPGKIGWYIDGIYTRVITTPANIANPLPIYEPDDTLPYLPKKDGNGNAIVVGTQKHANGSDRFMRFCMIINYAKNGTFTNNFVFDKATHHDANYRATLPAYNDSDEMIVLRMSAAPLAVDNPDEYGINYKGVPQPTINGGSYTGPGDGGVTNPVASATFEESFRYRIEATKAAEPGAPIIIKAIVTENPRQFPYQWVFAINPAAVPAGVTAVIEDEGTNYIILSVDTEGSYPDLINVQPLQDGDPLS